MNRPVLFVALAVLCSCSRSGDADFINTSIGVTDNRGSNCVVGPRLPYGSIYPSPQTENGSMDGYDPASPIRGFAQMHVSGTGWSSYGHFLVSPQIGLSLGGDTHDSPHSEDVTKAFYYSTHLDRYDITAEIVPSHYCAMYRFTYPESEDSYVVLDASQCIMDIARDMPRGRFTANSAEVDADGKVRMMLTFEGGWPAGAYNLYLVGGFDHEPSESGVWRDGSVLPGETMVSGVDDNASHIGAYVRFNTSAGEKVQMKLAVSFTSFEKAGEFLSAEMSGWDFDRKVDLARDEWNKKLSSIRIACKDETERTLFYSALFRFYTLASERTADNARWESDAPFWDDSYAYWDTFRSAYPLMMLIDEPAMRDNLNSMIDRFEHNGAVYDGFIAGAERSSEQGGNDVDHIIAESYLKGIEGVDWEKAYAIVRKNAEERRDGNEGDGFYRELGWIPNCVMSCSQGLEYSYNDYSAYLMAKGLGHAGDAEKYLERSGKWINMWNPALESDGFHGFIDALNADGSFASIDPKQYGGSWVSPFYEAASWTYSYYVPHDINRLIELMGGPEEYVRRLSHAYENRLIEYTNEPAFLITRTFSDAGRPDFCSYWTHRIMDDSYDMDGYPGNEDTGAMGSWYVFSAIGLFPNAGQDYYYLNAPEFTESVLDLGRGRTLTIRADAAPGKVYIKSCKVGGVEWNKATITHKELIDAGLIEMELSSTPTGWAAFTSAPGDNMACQP